MHKKNRDTKLEAKKNLLRKSEYKKEILKALAEEENKNPGYSGESKMSEAEEIVALQQLKQNKEAAKIQQAYRKNEKEKSIQTIKNKQRKDEHEKTIILALAEAEQVKEQRSLQPPVNAKKIGTKTFQYEIRPEIIKQTEKDAFKTVETTIIKFPGREVKLQKITYVWGNVDYYKNDIEIDEQSFSKEIAKFAKYLKK